MLAWIAYAVIALVWGSTYFAIRVALEGFTPYGLVAARFLLASILAFGVARLRRESLPSRKDLPHLAFTGALMLAGSNALVSWAETVVDTGFAATVCAMVPVFLALLSGSGLDAKAWFGLLGGLTGVAILADPFKGGVPVAGLAALLSANLLWAFGTLWGRKHVKGHGTPFANTGIQMLTAGIIALGAAPLTGGYLRGPVGPGALASVAYLALFGSVLALSAYTYLARTWTPARMGTYAYLNPVVAVLLGALPPLREAITSRTILGMAVILGSVALVQFGPRMGFVAALRRKLASG